MEYAAGGDMFEYVVRKGGLRESEARWFFQQLIVAVDYIHRMVRRPASQLGGGTWRAAGGCEARKRSIQACLNARCMSCNTAPVWCSPVPLPLGAPSHWHSALCCARIRQRLRPAAPVV